MSRSFALLTAAMALAASAAPTFLTTPANILNPGHDLLLAKRGNGGALVNVGAIVGVLSPAQCDSGTIGVEVSVTLGNLLSVCVCVEILGTAGQTPCPACGPNASPICGSGNCGCACDDGYFATSAGTCEPTPSCTEHGHLVPNGDGTSTCVCDAPYVLNNDGGCSLPSSPKTRSRMARKSQLQLDSNSSVAEINAFHCPQGEQACPLGNGLNSYECLDTTSSLDSCGGCITQGGVNCLTIPGALGVACVESRCEVSSCFPGWRFLNGHCVRTQ